MTDRSTETEQPPTSSPWPVLIAAGLVLSEVGILVGVLPIAVGGLVLLASSITGFITESGHVSSPWPLAIGFGALFVVLGGGLYAVGTEQVVAAGDDPLSLAARGVALAAAGVATAVGAVVLRYRRG
ncbi:hypothetical protein C491_11338 [Natronococcus amylolyticus DSM 10524]|uniref:Cox cluster protein n=1 Tax=Natronococcus amylolyticus DSM 10524 TaxID=1227497 RepID=L9X668_9EURY|nr:hypothetical protein [Natronococcus amylolyticus]ELY57097.1 hypothetical protein C491_11338 [Natronococcus amylolyticus DSM 10524]